MDFASKNLTAGQLNALVKILGGEEVVHGILNKSVEVVVNTVKLLRQLTIVSAAGIQKFAAAGAFGENNPDGIKFYLWKNFQNNFLGKIEEDVPAATIAVHRLEKSSRDQGIMAELGIDLETKKGVIKLAHFFELIKAQANGQEGQLLVNGYANIAYIEDENGKLWAVSADWGSDGRGWDVYASSVEDPREWRDGGRVLSQVS